MLSNSLIKVAITTELLKQLRYELPGRRKVDGAFRQCSVSSRDTLPINETSSTEQKASTYSCAVNRRIFAVYDNVHVLVSQLAGFHHSR